MGMKAETPQRWQERKQEFREGKSKFDPGLNLEVAVQMWPTPTVQDAKNNGGPSQRQSVPLPLNAEVGGALNPTWVEWLMGFPLGWTD